MSSTITRERIIHSGTGDRKPRSSWLSDGIGMPSLCGAWLLLGVALLCVGPFLSSHETIVAQSARQMLQIGDWIVPRYLDAPFLVKPPLAQWLAAVAGFLLPVDGATGLPVSTAAARLPSLLATLMTIVILYALARSMCGRRVAQCIAFVFATSAGTLTFALNATAEALLTLFCTWAYAEFWWSQQASGRARLFHQLCFFIAFGLAMMAKAPMPLLLVALPLGAWWWAERSTRLLADCGPRAAPGAVSLLARGFLSRTRLAATSLGLWWGLPLAGCFLVAWMWAASLKVPYLWRLWHVEYLVRLYDAGMWPKSHGPWYYFPVLLGLTAPWLLSVPEALAGPFLQRYRRHRRPLMYAWYWAIISTLVLSIMHFKQDYYLLPVLPAVAILLGPILNRLFFGPSLTASRGTVRKVSVLVLAILAAAPIAGYLAFRGQIGRIGWGGSLAWPALLVVVFVAGVLLAASLYLRGLKPGAFYSVGLTGFAAFTALWVAVGSDSMQLRAHAALVVGLRRASVPDHQRVIWVDSVPDGRVTFYFNRWVCQLGDPFEMRAEYRGQDQLALMLEMGSRICSKLEEETAYFVFKRKRYGLLSSVFHPKAFVLFEVDRLPDGPDGDDWLVVTNDKTRMK